VTSDELRALFLSFFEEKGHKTIPSSSLIPRDDPTLLLTTAGMVQIKPYFLGTAVPPSTRLASCQKCFRTTDIESIGDPGHLTFFEMLGNFSVGDYFKKEAIEWGWEFVAERLKLPTEHLWITIYLDDDEAYQHWRDIGVPEARIIRLGEKSNFWGPAGSSGPCGPCSEIHYDFGENVGCGRPDCGPECDCSRFSEIWNLVFTQYDQDEAGNRTPLPKPNIDTGMGLERTTALMQGKESVYDTDLFMPLMNEISELTGKLYGSDDDTDRAMRVVAEHSRGIAFLIADGVIPSNEGRGYVLKRLLRRAALFGRRLGIEAFLADTVEITIKQMGHIYPELQQSCDFVIDLVKREESRFDETLSTGLDLLDGIMAELEKERKREISGVDAFRLYDTYGFPVEITQEIASQNGLSVDIKGFEQEMEKQREKARAAHKFGEAQLAEGELGIELDIGVTPFVGYHNLEHKSVIIGFSVDGKSVDSVVEGQKVSLILETTPFYGEMGGQVGDTGEINRASGRFIVTNTVRIEPEIVVHQGQVASGSLNAGDEVEAVVDKGRRLDIARNHTATHLLQMALRNVLGEHVQQRGSVVSPERLRFDFSHLTTTTPEEIRDVQHLVNNSIRQNLQVHDTELSYKEAIGSGAIAFFDEKYGDKVRVLKIGEPSVSSELCGGTHVNATGEIGVFILTGESSIGAGLRRIEAITGRGAEEYIQKRLSDLIKISDSVDADDDSVVIKVHEQADELRRERKQRLALESELAINTAESLINKVETIGGINVLATRLPSFRMEIMREMSDFLRDKLKSAVLVLGSVYEEKPIFLAAVTQDLIAKGFNAGEIIKQVARTAGGGGGGKADLAQAGGKDISRIDEALGLVKKLVQEKLQ